MAETRQIFDLYHNKTVSIRNDLVLRLRGRYANGPTLANGEPEFGWNEFPTPPIQHEAAHEIERLRAAAARVCAFDWSSNDDDAVAAVDALCAALGTP